jgi:hypothetical protein
MSRSNFSPLSTPISAFKLMSGNTRAFKSYRTIPTIKTQYASIPANADEQTPFKHLDRNTPIPANAYDAHSVQSRPNTMYRHGGLITVFGHQLACMVDQAQYLSSFTRVV